MNSLIFPPEIRVVADVRWCGVGSMLAAAATWDGLAGQLSAAAQAAGAAAQAKAAANAFESALAAADHPVVVANRTELLQLLISNLLGLNAPGIAVTASQYAGVGAAKVGYHSGPLVAVAQLPQWQQWLQSLPGQPGLSGPYG